MRDPLLIFTNGRYSVSNIIEDRVGLLEIGEPNMAFILQFSPFDNDAVTFRADVFPHRRTTLEPMSDRELVGHVVLKKHESRVSTR